MYALTNKNLGAWISISVNLFCLVLEIELHLTLFSNGFQKLQLVIKQSNLHFFLTSLHHPASAEVV